MEKQPEAQGTVIRSTGSFYRVRLASGDAVDATLRGKFRLDEGIKSTNPIAVGDRVSVRFEVPTPVIVEILPRDNYILRRSTRLHSQTQILCSNITQAVMVATLAKPFTPLGYIDSFLVMCEAYHIPAVVVFNKIDLLKKQEELDRLDDYRYIYENAGYPVHLISAQKPEYAETVQALLKDKVTFLSGPSGAGKSTLVNLVDPTLNLRTAPLTAHSDKGRHTTTYAEMFQLSIGGAIIDAPGFREFAITGIAREELAHYFPEMRALMDKCRFNNCTHINEPGCEVLAGVEDGRVAHTRYHTYTNMLANIPQNSYQK